MGTVVKRVTVPWNMQREAGLVGFISCASGDAPRPFVVQIEQRHGYLESVRIQRHVGSRPCREQP